MECAQLVKANSIEGCKLSTVDVVYTRWRNLHKTSDMEVGSIGFHDRSKVKKISVTKNNAIVNRLNRTKTVILLCHYHIRISLTHRKPFQTLRHYKQKEQLNFVLIKKQKKDKNKLKKKLRKENKKKKRN
jgi:hypothetical protein